MSNTYSPSPAHRPQSSGVNPFARAMAEARGANPGEDPTQQPEHIGSEYQDVNQTPFNPAEQQRQMLEQQRRERLRLELHRRINPVDQKNVFDAKQQQIKQELAGLRREIDLLIPELNGLRQDIEIAAMSRDVEVGEAGKGAKSWIADFKRFVILVRQSIQSGAPWATTLQTKKSQQTGLNFSAKGHKQTKNIYDSMHHERQLARSGN